MNTRLTEQLRRITRDIMGADGHREIDAVSRAVVDLPYAALRRHAHAAALPGWLYADLAAAARTLLESYRCRPVSPPRPAPG